MNRLGRVAVVAVVPLATLSLFSGGLAAQDTTVVRPDSALRAEEDSATASPMLPIQPAAVPQGPLPPGSRYSFNRDSILWLKVQTLGELLTDVPGVFVTRPLWVGQPENIQYGGRGGSALEVYWDGMLYEPIGGDSLFVDPGRIPLTYVRRVDVEILPDRIKVYIVSERHEREEARSLIRVVSGRFSTAEFTALFQKRWRSGVGLDLSAHFLGTDGVDAPKSNSNQFDLWGKFSWNPSDNVGGSYQIIRQDHDRDAVSDAEGASILAYQGVRTDNIFTLFAGTRGDGLGLRVEGGLASSSWSSDSASPVPDQSLSQAWLQLRYADANLTASVRGTAADARTPWSVEGVFDWVPLPGVVLSTDARYRRHEGSRASKRLHAAVGLFRGPVWLVGEATLQDALQAPALLADTAISTFDYGGRIGVDTKPVTGWVGVVQRDAYHPLAYPNFPSIPELRPSPEATYLVADVHLRPFKAITLSGWYSDPVSGLPADFQPPKHARAEVTFRSTFWRTFRSGAFQLKVQLAGEWWSTGTAGLNEAGEPNILPGVSFYDAYLAVQLVNFTLFWNLRNALLNEGGFVPRFDYAKNAQLFGVSWTFSS